MTSRAEPRALPPDASSAREVAAARLALGLAAAAVSVPVLVSRHTYPLPAFYQEWLAFALALAALAALLFHPAGRTIRLPWIAAAPLTLLGAVVAQALLGRIAYVEQALLAGLYLLWAAALIWCGGVLRAALGPARVAEALALALLAAASASSLLAIAQLAGSGSVASVLVAAQPRDRAYANLTQPNLFADHLCLGLASLSFLAARGRLRLGAAAVAAVPLLFALALSQSRSAWALLLLLLAVSVWQRSRTHEPREGFRQVALSLGYLAGLLVAYLLAPGLDGGAQPIDQRLFRTADGVLARVELWSQAWTIFVGAPWLGAGLGQFAYARFWIAPPFDEAAAPGLFTHAHNIVLHLLAEFGLVVVGILAVLALRWLLPHLRRRPGIESAWLMSVIGILALHSMVEFPLWYANFLGIAALVLGAGAAGERGIGVQLGRPAVLGAVVVLGGMTLATSLGAYRGVERLFVGPAGEALPSVLVHESHKVETRSLFVPYVEFAYAGLLRADGAADPEALALNARALRFLPADHVAYRQVLLLAQAGEAAPAQALLRRAAAVYPQFLPRFEAVLERLAEQAPAPFEPLRAALNTTGG